MAFLATRRYNCWCFLQWRRSYKDSHKDELRNRRDTIFADKFFKLVAAPESPTDVDDVADAIALCLIDFQEATNNFHDN
ncbi:hypothetical protein [Scytonema sp. UIC 10036]|uniref:hypothetical protein n=1 Tax=Scytonema sp. UIC 10036 TaxID=2304196 RepID=UPI001FAA516E|nr:hypothetical protein [Scytonema sp. UIC 10036]